MPKFNKIRYNFAQLSVVDKRNASTKEYMKNTADKTNEVGLLRKILIQF